jgi:hypothetical protein
VGGFMRVGYEKYVREAVHKKQLELRPNDWILHRDKAPADRALPVSRQFMVQKLITEMERKACSPDLAQNDLRILPKIKSALNDGSFRDIEEKKKKTRVTTVLKAIPEHDFRQCFQL